MDILNQKDFEIRKLGECLIPSPMKGLHFTGDHEHILYHKELENLQEYLDAGLEPPRFEAAGPREKIFFTYLGNTSLRAGRDTICPTCGKLLIERKYYSINIDGLNSKGECSNCHYKLTSHF
mgnify:CR=1 FL=1